MALIAASALMAAAHGPYYTFYSIHLVGLGYSKAMTGWLWALGVVCEIVIFAVAAAALSAFTLRAILIASFALAAARFLMIGWGAQASRGPAPCPGAARGDVRLVSRGGDRHRAPALSRAAPGARPGDLRQPYFRRRRRPRRARERLCLGDPRRRARRSRLLRPRALAGMLLLRWRLRSRRSAQAHELRGP